MNKVVYLETDLYISGIIERLVQRSFPPPLLEFKPVENIGLFKVELAAPEPVAAVIVGMKENEFLVAKRSYEKMLRSSILSGTEIIFHTPEDPNFPDFWYYFVSRKQRHFDIVDALRTALKDSLPPEFQ